MFIYLLLFFCWKVHYCVRVMQFYIFVHWLCWNDIQLKMLRVHGFHPDQIQKKKSQMYKNMIRAELRDNLPVARSEFSIDILKQIAYMTCTNCILFLCLENGKALSTVSPAPRQTHKPLFFFPCAEHNRD